MPESNCCGASTHWLIYAQAAKKEKEAAKALAKAAKAKEKKSKK